MRGLGRRLLSGHGAEHTLALAGYLGFVISVVPFVAALVQSIANRQWAATAAWAFLLSSLGWLAAAFLRSIKAERPESTLIFRPFEDLSTIDPWPRPEEVASVADAVLTPRSVLPLVIGESGAGKTTLLRVMLPKRLTLENVETIYVDTYVDWGETSRNLVRRLDRDSSQRFVVILDQFEQFLGRLRQLPLIRRNEVQRGFRADLAALMAKGNMSLVMAVRQEWYYALRFLDELVPSPSEAINIAGPAASETGSVLLQTIISRFAKIVGDEEEARLVVEEIAEGARLLPLGVQVVGASLERARRDGEIINLAFLRETGGAAGAIDRYFTRDIDAAPDPRVALKVLCALSARTRFRSQEDLSDILDRLYEDANQVREAVAYLLEINLLVERQMATYELTHDFLAEYFYQKSGASLNPLERDNVLFHIDRAGARSGVVLPRQVRERQRPVGWGWGVVVPLVVLMILRLMYFGVDVTVRGLGPSPLPTIGGNLFDAVYAPIFVPHLAWALYVAMYHDRILRRLDEGPVERIFSRVVVLNMAACVVVAMFIPGVWLASIAWGGLVVGIKMRAVAAHRELNEVARDRLRQLAVVTLVDMAFLTGLGIAGLLLTIEFVDSGESVQWWLLGSAIFAVGMTFACYALAPLHVQRSAVSQMLGLLAREKSSYVAARV